MGVGVFFNVFQMGRVRVLVVVVVVIMLAGCVEYFCFGFRVCVINGR